MFNKKDNNGLLPDEGKSHWHLIFKAAAFLEASGHFELAKALKNSECAKGFTASVYELDSIILVVVKAALELERGFKYNIEDLERGGCLYPHMEDAEKAVNDLIDNDFKLPVEYQLPPPEPLNNQDVHTKHCCGQHKRCKYGLEEGRIREGYEMEQCTVVSGKKAPSFPCNCNWM